MADVFFLSYQEPNADDNFSRLLSIAPHAKRIHGIAGMHQAFRAPLSHTDANQFYIVDGDSWVDSTFPFSEHVLRPAQVLVWQARNAVNNLTYGYGGIKLFDRRAAERIDQACIDVIGAPGQEVSFIKEVASTTAFNVTDYDSWKAGFREVAMLTHSSRFRTSIDEAQARINTWKSVGSDRPFGEWAIRGAHDGEHFVLTEVKQLSDIATINDFTFLRTRFNSMYRNTSTLTSR